MRVRTGCLYRYNPNGWDTFTACTGNNLVLGQIVRVISLPMAPKANTMGQCYVAEPETRKFICMVSTGSLERMTPEQIDVYYRLRDTRTRQRAEPVSIKILNDGAMNPEASVIE